MARLHHDSLSLPDIPALSRADAGLEVWHDPIKAGELHHITLGVEFRDRSEYVDLLPTEARTLAALLINAAEHQERAALATRLRSGAQS